MKIVDKVLDKLEIGENGKVDMDDVVTLLSRSEDSDVDRKAFLEEVLNGKVSREIIEKAIETDPIRAGIPIAQLQSIAAEVIASSKAETNAKEAREDVKNKAEQEESALKKVVTAAGSIKENRYKRAVNRATLKLMYLFGFGQIDRTEKGTVTDEKDNLAIILADAYMFEAEGAADAFRALVSVYPKVNVARGSVPEDIRETVKSFRKKLIAFQGSFPRPIPIRSSGK